MCGNEVVDLLDHVGGPQPFTPPTRRPGRRYERSASAHPAARGAAASAPGRAQGPAAGAARGPLPLRARRAARPRARGHRRRSGPVRAGPVGQQRLVLVAADGRRPERRGADRRPRVHDLPRPGRVAARGGQGRAHEDRRPRPQRRGQGGQGRSGLLRLGRALRHVRPGAELLDRGRQASVGAGSCSSARRSNSPSTASSTCPASTGRGVLRRAGEDRQGKAIFFQRTTSGRRSTSRWSDAALAAAVVQPRGSTSPRSTTSPATTSLLRLPGGAGRQRLPGAVGAAPPARAWAPAGGS